MDKKELVIYRIMIIVFIIFIIIIVNNTFQNNKNNVTYFKAGEISTSINELGELQLIDRDFGNPVILDSNLTEIIGNQIAARKYLKLNQ